MAEQEEQEFYPSDRSETSAEESHPKSTNNWESYSLALLTYLDD